MQDLRSFRSPGGACFCESPRICSISSAFVVLLLSYINVIALSAIKQYYLCHISKCVTIKHSAGTFHKSYLNNEWVEIVGANNATKMATNMLEIGADS